MKELHKDSGLKTSRRFTEFDGTKDYYTIPNINQKTKDMKQFATPVSMEVTVEQYERDLKQPLKEMGYVETNMSRYYDSHIYLITNYDKRNGSLFVSNRADAIRSRHLVKDYNPELFLALAAMTKEADWIVGEWLMYVDASPLKLFKVKNLYGANSDDGSADNVHKRIYRKATKEELVSKLSQTKTSNERVFPLDLSPVNAQRIIDAACNTWKPKLAKDWSKRIVLDETNKISKSEYTDMRKACTKKQNILFDDIFGEDVEDEPEFKVGKWYKYASSMGGFSYYYILGLNKNYGIACGNGWVENRTIGLYSKDFDLATDEEVRKALIKEAKKRGYVNGSKVKCLIGGALSKEINGEFFSNPDGVLVAKQKDQPMIGQVIFKNGEWAEIIKEKVVEEMTMAQVIKELGRSIKIVE